MALTAQQESDWKKMFKLIYSKNPDWLMNQLLTLLTPTQDETSYDAMRTAIINYLDAQIADYTSASTDLETQKTQFPSRI